MSDTNMLLKFKKKIVRLLSILMYRHMFSKSNIPIINAWCKLRGNITFGKNNHFNGAEIYGSGSVTFGDNFHSAQGLVILTQNHNWKGDALPYDDTIILKPVNIGDNVWVGMNVIILPGVTIGEGCIIQAGSVVSKSIPNYAIAGGNPASIIKYRDLEHYEELKLNEKFH